MSGTGQYLVNKEIFKDPVGYPRVDTFAELPNVATFINKVYLVMTGDGINSSGIYYSNGTNWICVSTGQGGTHTYQLTVSATPPANPQIGDVWLDIS